ncbi:CopG family transcriptional regulator, partial [Candidatus Woesearchaeota archaeon]|nr:CopG family transcriptional regulator [Candidatus Woesearchaeota archaeon]
KKLSRDSGFGSSSEFITYLLRDLLGSMSEKKKDEEKFSDSDNKRLRQRLAALGYLS